MFYEFQHFGIPEYLKKEYGKNFVFPVHLHHSFEFITVLEGKMSVTVDGNEYTLTKGKALLIFPDQIHSLSGEGSFHMLCIFSPDLVKSYSAKVADKIAKSNLFCPDENLIHAIDTLSDGSDIILKKGIFYCLCAAFDGQAQYIRRDSKSTNLMHDIFKFVETNFGKDCTLKKLSKVTGFSYSYLSRHFKKVTGTSFNSYVNRYRISNACHQLLVSDCSVLRCALDCGYDSLRSFNRNFRELVGTTPNEYRAKQKTT